MGSEWGGRGQQAAAAAAHTFGIQNREGGQNTHKLSAPPRCGDGGRIGKDGSVEDARNRLGVQASEPWSICKSDGAPLWPAAGRRHASDRSAAAAAAAAYCRALHTAVRYILPCAILHTTSTYYILHTAVRYILHAVRCKSHRGDTATGARFCVRADQSAPVRSSVWYIVFARAVARRKCGQLELEIFVQAALCCVGKGEGEGREGDRPIVGESPSPAA